jgi:DNA gyrase/topoisomerase IV subunit A
VPLHARIAICGLVQPCKLTNYCHQLSVQVLPIARTSAIAAMLPVSEFAKDLHLVMLTAHGQMKRTPLSQFSKINNRGIVAMTLRVIHKKNMCALETRDLRSLRIVQRSLCLGRRREMPCSLLAFAQPLTAFSSHQAQGWPCTSQQTRSAPRDAQAWA